MGKQWKVVNGKWVSTETTSNDVVENGCLKYGSLDRRLLHKKKFGDNGILSACNIGEAMENQRETISPNKSISKTPAVADANVRLSQMKHTHQKQGKRSITYFWESLNKDSVSSGNLKHEDLTYGSLDRKLYRKKKSNVFVEKKLNSADKKLCNGVLDLREDSPEEEICGEQGKNVPQYADGISTVNSHDNSLEGNPESNRSNGTTISKDFNNKRSTDGMKDLNNNDAGEAKFRPALSPKIALRSVIKKVSEIGKTFEKKSKPKEISKETFLTEKSIGNGISKRLAETVTSSKEQCRNAKLVKQNEFSVNVKNPSSLKKRSADWNRSHSDNIISTSHATSITGVSKGTSSPALLSPGLPKGEKHPIENSTNHSSIITTESSFNKGKHDLIDGDKRQRESVDKNNNDASGCSVQHSLTRCGDDKKVVSKNTAGSFVKSQNCSVYGEEEPRLLVTRSASPTVGRRKRNSFEDTTKSRNHSTGHSPDITKLLQHLICDIEEEVLCEGEISPEKKHGVCSFKQSQLDNFDSNLREMPSQSADSLNTDQSDRKHFRLRKTLSEDDVGLKLLREQRRKRKQTIASGEKLLQRKPSVIWARVKRMEISLIIDNDLEDPDIVKIESFDVRRVNTHKDIEELAVDTFIKHVQLLDKHVLDLRKTDILYLKLQGHEIPLGAKFDLSSTKIQDGFLPCQLCIKGKEQWSLAAMAYDTLIPKSYLEKYLSLILSNQYVVFYGSSGTGKSYLARRLAMYVTHRMNEGAVPPIILKNITPERWKFLLDNLRSEKRDFPFVVMIDGFSQTFFNAGTDICDLISLCDKLDPKPYVICTLTQVPHKGIPPLWQQDFRWIWLPNHEEPIDGILQRYLRRKFIHHGNIHLQRESFRIADWLYNTWKYINEILEKLNSTEATLGPTMFYTCPTDILTAEEWFVDLWNYSVTPYFILTAKQGLKAHGQREEWQDPLPCILKSYPWVSEKAKRKMKLRRIRMEDVGYQNKIPPACTTLDETQNEQQRLFDFLRQLETLMQDGGLGEFPIFTKTKERILESSI